MSMAYTVVALLLLASLAVLFMVWRERESGKRDRAIGYFLDSADALELELQRCKQRMQELQSWVQSLPGAGSREAADRLGAADAVQVALKQLLGQRLWLKDSADTATLVQIQAANERLDRSRETLANQMSRLEQIREELERAAESHARLAAAPRKIDVGGDRHTLH
jgi:chaperonin cofactor prefoldin